MDDCNCKDDACVMPSQPAMTEEEKRQRRKEQKAAYDRKRRMEAKAHGLCLVCTKRPATRGTMCESCADKMVERKRKSRELTRKGKSDWLADANRCPFCGEPVVPGHKCCEKHLKLLREATRRRYGEIVECVCTMDCVNCPFDECVNDYVRPEYPTDKEKDAKRHRDRYKARKENGLCVQCGKPLDEASKAAGRVHCSWCLAYRREYQKTSKAKRSTDVPFVLKRREWRANGLCWFCGEPVVPGYKVCQRHLKLYRYPPTEKQKAAREKMKERWDKLYELDRLKRESRGKK